MPARMFVCDCRTEFAVQNPKATTATCPGCNTGVKLICDRNPSLISTGLVGPKELRILGAFAAVVAAGIGIA
jgi:hypothetical protein